MLILRFKRQPVYRHPKSSGSSACNGHLCSKQVHIARPDCVPGGGGVTSWLRGYIMRADCVPGGGHLPEMSLCKLGCLRLMPSNVLGCVSRKRRKPKLIVEFIVGRSLVLRAVPKDIVAKVCLENS